VLINVSRDFVGQSVAEFCAALPTTGCPMDVSPFGVIACDETVKLRSLGFGYFDFRQFSDISPALLCIVQQLLQRTPSFRQ
jgi:hypothetical protein